LPTDRDAIPTLRADHHEAKERFRDFTSEVEPRLHGAFLAAYGHERGREATAEALAYAWEHWAEIRPMSNPVGYLYRVGQSRTRSRRTPIIFVRPDTTDVHVEPELPSALASLSERQRIAVLLVHGEGWSMREVGDFLGVSIPTVQKHVDRALKALRKSLKADTTDGDDD
jgi:DNA-directed RNA polymerase specialized sigma24 family protein